MFKNRFALLLLLIAGIVTFSIPMGLASDDSSGSAKTTEVLVTIQNFSFNPAEITVTPGTQVTWINQDSVGHNVVFSDTKGPLLKKGDKWSRVFDSAGTYTYMCGPHHFMKGTVIVK